MDIHLNTLYVFTPGAYLHRDHQTVKIMVEKETKLAIPIHHLDSIAVFGPIMVTPGLMELCVKEGVSLTFLSDSGRLIARVDAPRSGNVLLRREQFRRADQPDACIPIARCFVAGKLHNARISLLRSAREGSDQSDSDELNRTASVIGEHIRDLGSSISLDSIRGHEGDSARIYFSAFPRMIRNRDGFSMNGRTRRPPLDAVNAMLSFTYALMVQDCVAALTSAGLDPDVGFLHADRPGRPSLALDLVEEFRTLIADRLVLSLINRKQIKPSEFTIRDGGGVEMSTSARKSLVQAYVSRKREEVKHPLLDRQVRIGQLPFLQAKLLARHLRGDSEIYIPCVLR